MNYFGLVLALRNLKKNKIPTILKIAGVFLGISLALILFLYVEHERSIDHFYPNFTSIYRVSNSYNSPNDPGWSGPTVAPPVAGVIVQNFPQVESYTRVFPDNEMVFSFEDKSFEEDKVYYVDSTFFKVFEIPLVAGNPEECLKVRNSAVLSVSTAKKYFGTTDCVGKTLEIEKRPAVIITGIYDDLPSTSSFNMDLLLSWSSPNFVSQRNDNNWNLMYVLTFLKISQPINCDEFSLALTNVLEVNRPKDNQDSEYKYYIEPLKDLYLNSQFASGAQKSGNSNLVAILFAAGLILIFLGWINYTNIATAVSIKRQNEVSVLRFNGAKKSELFKRFFIESIVINLVAIGLAVAFTALLLPYINKLLGLNISFDVLNKGFYQWLILLLLGGTILNAVYESFILSSLSMSFGFKSGGSNANRGKILKHTLLAFQYFSCILMIFYTLVIFFQTRHLINKEIGIKSSNVLVLKGSNLKGYQKDVFNKMESFKKELIAFPEVNSVTSSNTIPANYSFIDGVHRPGRETEKSVSHTIVQGDNKFLDTYEVDIIAGNTFYENTASNMNKALISESSARYLGFSEPKDAIGEFIVRDFLNREYEILGVFKDFKLGNKSLETYPIAIYHQPQEARFISVSYTTPTPLKLFEKINAKWQTFFPELYLRHFYLDQSYNAFYTTEISQQKIFILFSLSSIVINCLGLFALALFTMERRTKEIGVRKVNGARVIDVLILIFKEYFILILISALVALPLAYFISKNWLKDYGEKIEIGPTFYLFPIITVFIISILTIFYHSLKVANRNPVEALRYE